VTATGTPLGAIQATGGPGAAAVVGFGSVVNAEAGADVEDAGSDVEVASTVSPAHAPTEIRTARSPVRRLMSPQLWHG
jgi:hypothetical protein